MEQAGRVLYACNLSQFGQGEWAMIFRECLICIVQQLFRLLELIYMHYKTD